MGKLNHFDEKGRARMVDVSAKTETVRRATASGEIRMRPETLAKIREGKVAKGNVPSVADVAAIMGAKKTPEMIPMCHPLMLSGVSVSFDDLEEASGLRVQVEVNCRGATGVEMEALMAVCASLLTVYDMCKAMDRGMTLSNIRLEAKEGGKSGDWRREEAV
jgi:cyclic pyranopterin phosphate synthase